MPDVSREIAPGVWVPAVPLKAPVDVRWCCSHEWTPHIYEGTGWTAQNYFDCLRCGAEIEAGVQPHDGPRRARRWLALRLFSYGRKVHRG